MTETVELPGIIIKLKAELDLDTSSAEKKIASLALKLQELKAEMASILKTDEKKEIIITATKKKIGEEIKPLNINGAD